MSCFVKSQDGAFVNLSTVHKIELCETSGEIQAISHGMQDSITVLFKGSVAECKNYMEVLNTRLEPLLAFPKTTTNLPEDTKCRLKETIKLKTEGGREIPAGAVVRVKPYPSDHFNEGERYTVFYENVCCDDVCHTLLELLD